MGEIYDTDDPPVNGDLVTNNDFNSSADWTSTYGHWYISSPPGRAVCPLSPDYYSTPFIGGTIPGQKYAIEFRLLVCTGKFQIIVGDTLSSIYGSPGTYAVDLVAGTLAPLRMFSGVNRVAEVDWIKCKTSNPISDDIIAFFDDFGFFPDNGIRYYDPITQQSNRNVFRAARTEDFSHVLVKFEH